MLKVEFGEKRNAKNEYAIPIIVNGIADNKASYSTRYHNSATFYNDDTIEELIKYSFAEVRSYFSVFDFYQEVQWWDEDLLVKVQCGPYFDDLYPQIRIDLRLEPEYWTNLWSIVEFAETLKQLTNRIYPKHVKYYQDSEDFVTNGFGIDVLIESAESIIGDEFNYALQVIETLVSEANRILQESLNPESLSVFFNFPPEIRTSCKQYLIYFAQFLADIGIEANTELKQQANQTLFTISPTQGEEALIKIKDALAVYINAPNNPAFQVQTTGSNDLAIIQWKANVLHLESQLMLATATIQAKDAAIEALKLTNYQYSQMLTSKKEKKGEEILDGLVTVKEYEGPGFSVDMAEVFRRLKRKFIKDA